MTRGVVGVGALVLLVLLVSACGSGSQAGAGGGARQTLSVPELKYRVVDRVGPPQFCGPPVVRYVSPAEAASGVEALRAGQPEVFQAIVDHQHLDPARLDYQDDLVVLRQATVLTVLDLTPQGDRYRFDYVAGGDTTRHVVGTVDAEGVISLQGATPTTFPGPGGCPVCLAASDRVDGPSGPAPVTSLHAGELIWTIDASGRRVAAAVLAVSHRPAPPGHHVVHLVLEDGRTVDASPGHPTADGRPVGDLRPGDPLDGSRVAAARLDPYSGDTWDVLPAGPSNVYWVGGIPLRSTIT